MDNYTETYLMLWIIFDAVIFICLLLYVVRKYGANTNVLDVPKIKKCERNKDLAQKISIEFENCYKIVNTTTNPHIFFANLSICHDYLLALMTFKIKFEAEKSPDKKFAKLRLDIEWITNNMLNRSYAKLEEDISKITDAEKIPLKIMEYFKDIDSAFKDANSLWIKSRYINSIDNPEHYLSNLYTAENLRKIENFKQIISKKYNVTIYI